MKIALSLFEKMTSLDHLFQLWDQFKRGKRKRKDIQCFERHLEDNIFQTSTRADHFSISTRFLPSILRYGSQATPHQQGISKRSISPSAVYDTLNDVLDKKFIFHSFSSRKGKGTHIGVIQLRRMIRKVSANGTRPCYALKMDIRRFFDTVDHSILKTLLRKNIKDENALKMTDMIIDSFRNSADQEMLEFPWEM